MPQHEPLTLSSTTATTSPLPLPLRNNIYSALMSQSTSSGGIPAIQALLTHELQASGWITELRAYVTTLLRSGECTSVREVMERVMREVGLGIDGLEDKEGRNGAATNGNAVNGESTHRGGEGDDTSPHLQLPERAVREGVRVVRRELEKVCEITVEE